MKFQKKMLEEIILASKSLVRKKILEENGIKCIVEPSNIDEDLVKESLLKENATPKLISKNLAELKANKVSQKRNGNLVLGADSLINFNEKIISKPSNRDEALDILKKLNGQKHQLISSVCISKNGFHDMELYRYSSFNYETNEQARIKIIFNQDKRQGIICL